MDRDLKLLLQKHQFDISALLGCTSSLSDGERSEIVDVNLLCLRFILSADSATKARENLNSYLAWRFKESGRAAYACLKEKRLPDNWDTMIQFAALDFHGQSLDGDFLFVIRAGLSNGKALMKALTQDQVVQIMLFNRTRMMDMCDLETLKTGRLTKFITINDLAHTSISRMSGPFNTALQQTTKLSEVYFPQLLDSAVLIHMPSAMRIVFSTVKRLLPAKVQAKIRVCAAKSGESISKCPWATKHLSIASVPTFLGGECRCPHSGGCIAGVNNDQKVANLVGDSDDGLKPWNISRAKRYDVFATVSEPGSTIIWQVQVEKGTLSSGSVTIEAVLRATSQSPPEVLSTLIDKREVKPEGLISGEVLSPHAGTCVFSITNSSSVWSRSIKYSLEVLTPKGMIEEGTEGPGGQESDNINSADDQESDK